MSQSPQPTWTGDKVRLRAIEPDDWEAFWRNDEDTEAQRLSWRIPFPRSAERAQQWARDQALVDADSADWFILAVEALDTGKLVGSVTVHGIDRRNGQFEYGLGIFPAQRRRGYASDAILVLVRYYFEELRFQHAVVTVYAFNEPSLALHRALGFVEEGRLRRAVFTGGEFHDEVIFGMIPEELDARE